jgi:hypothetical protein
VILKDSFVAFAARGRHFDVFKLGGLHEKYTAAIWNLETI